MRIDGTTAAGFEPVRDAFAENFASRGEIGAALCVTAAGRVVADLWGGWAAGGSGPSGSGPSGSGVSPDDRAPDDRAPDDRAPDDAVSPQASTAPWRPDTLVNFFSVGKGLLALLAARLAGDGRLDVDAPVTRYWPEFGAAGKAAITVRHLLTHQAGLPAIRRRLPPDAMFDWRLMTSELAGHPPWWEPGTAHGYHVNTFGFLVGEVLRRASGRSVGALLRAEVAGPLGADVHIGLDPAEHARVADFAWPGQMVADEAPELPDDKLMEHNAYFNPVGLSGAGIVNTAAWRQSELPSTNGHGTARGIARIYTALAAGGATGGVRVVDSGALAAAVTEQVYGDDLILHRRSRFGLGFQLTQAERPIGPNQEAFGHFGAGGSLGFCDPLAGVGFGYVTGEMGPRWRNPRNRALIEALYSCLNLRFNPALASWADAQSWVPGELPVKT